MFRAMYQGAMYRAKVNVPQAEPNADDCQTLIDKPVKNFYPSEPRLADIRLQFYPKLCDV